MTNSNIWKEKEFFIATGTKEETIMVSVNGEVKGYFGIHGTPFNYKITHLPTGYNLNKIIPEGMQRTKKNMKMIVDKISRLDWNFTDPKESLKLLESTKELIKSFKFPDL